MLQSYNIMSQLTCDKTWVQIAPYYTLLTTCWQALYYINARLALLFKQWIVLPVCILWTHYKLKRLAKMFSEILLLPLTDFIYEVKNPLKLSFKPWNIKFFLKIGNKMKIKNRVCYLASHMPAKPGYTTNILVWLAYAEI